MRPLLQQDEPAETPPEPEPAPASETTDRVVISVAASPPDARNKIAVRSALVAAALSQFLLNLLPLLLLPVLGPIPVIGFLLIFGLFLGLIGGGGWYASFLFQRRSGEPATSRNGARLGWICGIFSFFITTIFFALNALAMVNSPAVQEASRKNATALGLPAGAMDQSVEMFKNPLELIFGLVLLFIVFTLTSSIGGLIHGYTSSRRERQL